MSATEGNKFWLLRSRHGRKKLFASPKLMWEAASEYFEWCEENPIMKSEAIKSGNNCGELIEIPLRRPFSMDGLTTFLCVNTVYFNNFEASLKAGIVKNPEGFSEVIANIKQIIRAQKYEGALVGQFNANLISRDLGMADNINNTFSNPDGSPLVLPSIQVFTGSALPLAASEEEIKDQIKLIPNEKANTNNSDNSEQPVL